MTRREAERLTPQDLPWLMSPPRHYHPHRPDGLDRNLTRLNEADYLAGTRCTCDDCVRQYEDCRRYRNTCIVMGGDTMTRKEAERLTHQADTLRALGFTREESEQLRRISMTLHRWFERECGDGYGCIERDEQTGKPYWHRSNHSYLDPHDPRAYTPIADREAGARRRLKNILRDRNLRDNPSVCDESRHLSVYIQTDPRGAALYLLRPGDVPEGQDAGSYYTRGICVY